MAKKEKIKTLIGVAEKDRQWIEKDYRKSDEVIGEAISEMVKEIQSLITQSNKEVEKRIWDKVKKEYVHITKVNWSKFPPTTALSYGGVPVIIDDENLPQDSLSKTDKSVTTTNATDYLYVDWKDLYKDELDKIHRKAVEGFVMWRNNKHANDYMHEGTFDTLIKLSDVDEYLSQPNPSEKGEE